MILVVRKQGMEKMKIVLGEEENLVIGFHFGLPFRRPSRSSGVKVSPLCYF